MLVGVGNNRRFLATRVLYHNRPKIAIQNFKKHKIRTNLVLTNEKMCVIISLSQNGTFGGEKSDKYK